MNGGVDMRWILLVVVAMGFGEASAQEIDLLNSLKSKYEDEAGPAQPAVPIPHEYLTGIAPDGLRVAPPPPQESPQSETEKPQAFDGTTYTVIAPIFLGQNGNFSYIRFWNIETSTRTVTIRIVGWPSGEIYGATTATIPSAASPQFAVTDILSAAGVTGLSFGDEGYSLYVANTSASVGFMHVMFNANSLFFENVSICQSSILSSLQSYLMNVHSSLLPAYPSSVIWHNYLATSQTLRVFVLESRTGRLLGSKNYVMAPNGTYTIPIAFLEQDIGYTPSAFANEYHYNLLLGNADTGGLPQIVAGQVIFNPGINAYINMTEYCDIKQ